MAGRLLSFAAVVLAATGCAGTDEGRFRAPDHATWGDWNDGSSQPQPQTVSRTVFMGPDGPYEAIHDSDGRTVVPQAPVASEAPSRPPPVGPRTVKLRQAPLESALRLLAEAGDFNLLLEGDLSKPVSGDLKDVDPYEALVALAGAHGAFVRFDGRIVVVTAHGSKP